MSRVAIVAAALGFAACDAREPPPRWAYVHAAILQPNCTTSGCHGALTAITGLPLSNADEAYNVLTGRVCGEPYQPGFTPRNYVDPGSPERSLLIQRLLGTDVDVMPPDRPLPELEIDLVAQWIEEGAACD